ncbi:Ubiquitin carboxyl-terminal hydrolase [Thalictrum thalictroides]|uniref:Ubiquitin carboxyl-terminal hydrolase n=1 Tax=Thalictrum thalictroides TaxID=46969 RepID=A0A7J6WBA8_THATH|nr:Ubiquitin carboxyl-terminal hydrolase [Thalictrum thalictroides]
MGKKVKKRNQNAQKEKRGSSDNHGTNVVHSNPQDEVVGDGVLVAVKGRTCTHIEKGIDLIKLSEKFGSKGTEKCEDCREGSADRKGRSKHGKKGTGGVGKKKDCVWVCLQCGHFSCGGVGFPTTPQCHAIRHNRQTKHPCVIQLQNPKLCWCFPCDSPILVGKSEQDDPLDNVLSEVVKLIKGGLSEVPSIDVEDVWFGSGSGKGLTTIEATDSLVSSRKGGYAVRGLANLGNTCFFNSVMQNLFAMDKLRDYFMKLDQSVGPLTMALKKLFSETSSESGSRSGISPRNLFGCICSRAPQFRGHQQQDSHELLRCLLDGLCTEELNMRKSLGSSKEDGVNPDTGFTFVDMIFGGQLSSTVSCKECKHSSVVHEPFLDLSLPVPTKKSPSRKVSRAKLPAKNETRKGGKIRGKWKTDSAPALVPCATVSSETIESSSLASSSLPPEEGKVEMFDDNWLDWVASDTTSNVVDSVSQDYDSALIQDPESKPSYPLEEDKVNFSDGVSRLDHMGHDSTSNELDSVSQNHDILPIKVSEGNDDMSPNSSESQSQVFSTNIEPKQKSEWCKGSSSEDNLPVLQGPEVLLLPYKEENSTTGGEMANMESGAPSLVLGCEEDSLEFDGFGDLFNEPKMDSVPNLHDKSSQEIEATETGFIAGNSSESDPDEVDDTNAPVSINSCLAYFTKPEILSEHAWHCENCSKTLQGLQLYSVDNQSKSTVKKKTNGIQLRSQNDQSGGDLSNSCADSSILENVNSDNDFGCNIERREDLLSSSNSLQEVSPFVTDCKLSNQASSNNQTGESCSVNDSDNTGNDGDQVQVSKSKVSARESQNSEVDEKCVKVMRDATKRYLLHKVPLILTIHLKRFSQDGRGRLSKLSGHVCFQDKLDLSPYISSRSSDKNNSEYHLIGIVEHLGSMRGGHYVAYVRGEKRRGVTEQDKERYTWFYASDNYVREVSFAEVLRREAYILFYEKV